MSRRANQLRAELGRLRRDRERILDGAAVDSSPMAQAMIDRQIENIKTKLKEYE